MRRRGEGGRRRRWAGTASLVLAGIVLAWGIHGALVVATYRPEPTTSPVGEPPPPAYPPGAYREVVAALHLHTRASWDGVGTVEDLTRAALDSGIEAAFLAEHNNAHAWEDAGLRIEQVHGREEDTLLVVPGVEVSTPQGHYLLWGVSGHSVEELLGLYKGKTPAAAADSLARASGGIGFVAHPRGDRRPWKGDLPPGCAGIEIVNGATAWRDDPVGDLLRSLVFYPFDSPAALASLVDKPAACLALWDSLLATRTPMPLGLASLDAHGGIRIDDKRRIRFPSYAAVLPIAHQHLLVRAALWDEGTAAARQAACLEALAAGRHFAALDGFGDTSGFRFWGEFGDETCVSGERSHLADGGRICARVPRGPRVRCRLIGPGGAVVGERYGWDVEFPVHAPGRYRLEVEQERRRPFGGSLMLPWIYSNPIEVDEAEAEAP